MITIDIMIIVDYQRSWINRWYINADCQWLKLILSDQWYLPSFIIGSIVNIIPVLSLEPVPFLP